MIAGVVCRCIATAIQNCSHRAKQPSYSILVGCYLDELKDWQVATQCGFGKGIRLYDPPKTAKFKRSLHKLAKASYHGKPLDGELEVIVIFGRAVQKSISKKRTQTKAVRTS